MGLDITIKSKTCEKYFRKVNFLIPFVESKLDRELEDCESVDLSVEDMTDLVERCKTVLENHDKAEELLPTQSGFFFGSTDYDEWYFRDVQQVYDDASEVLGTMHEGDTAAFWAWW
jgi:hypothetical protein